MIRISYLWYVVLGWTLSVGTLLIAVIYFGAPSFPAVFAALFVWLVLPRLGPILFTVVDRKN